MLTEVEGGFIDTGPDFEDAYAVLGSQFRRIDGLLRYPISHKYAIGEPVTADELPDALDYLFVIGTPTDDALDLLLTKSFRQLRFVGCLVTDRELRLTARSGWNLEFELCDLSGVTQPPPNPPSSLSYDRCAGPPAPGALRPRTLSLHYPTFLPPDEAFTDCRHLFVYGDDRHAPSDVCARIAAHEDICDAYLYNLWFAEEDYASLFGSGLRRLSIGDVIVQPDRVVTPSRVERLSFQPRTHIDRTTLLATLRCCPALKELELPEVRVDRELAELLVPLPLETLHVFDSTIGLDAVPVLASLGCDVSMREPQRTRIGSPPWPIPSATACRSGQDKDVRWRVAVLTAMVAGLAWWAWPRPTPFRDPRLVGRWESTADGSSGIEFRADGLYDEFFQRTRVSHGEWRTDGRRLTHRPFWAEDGPPPEQTCEFGIDRDELRLDRCKFWIRTVPLIKRRKGS